VARHTESAAAVAAFVACGCTWLAPTVRFDGWTVTCSGVRADDCEGVARLVANNLVS
jgi:hypothetical protein